MEPSEFLQQHPSVTSDGWVPPALAAWRRSASTLRNASMLRSIGQSSGSMDRPPGGWRAWVLMKGPPAYPPPQRVRAVDGACDCDDEAHSSGSMSFPTIRR
jgi:hypothetical protein